MKNIDKLCALFVSLTMAINYLVQKEVVKTFPPYLMFSLEALIVVVCTYPFSKKMPLPFSKMMLLSFIWGPLTYCSLIAAASMGLDVSVMLIAGKTNTIFAIIISAIFLREKITTRSALGVLMAFIGLIVLTKAPNVLDKPLAFLLVMVFAISWAIYTVLIKIYKPKDMLALLCWLCMLSFPQTIFISIIFEESFSLLQINATSIVGLVYLALIGIFLTMYIWYSVISKNDINKIVPFILLTPIFGCFLAYIIYREPMSTNMIIASIMVISGVAVSTIRR
ncbi:DMT family transporter [Anaplasmataceae bacterium AB001_6]|nr:DMT family transporter [Anaplasmataceae bacterium AB001_6]